MTIDELLAYTAGERDKWQQWFEAQTTVALDAAVQREGDFNDVWRLMHHIFLVEKRHTQRLKQESPLMEQIGVARHNLKELFSFGRAVRGEFMEFIQSASETDLNRTLDIHFRGKDVTVTARKIAFHTQFHEIRHWAQIATAVRNAGFQPPGFHDLLFSSALR